MGRIRVGGVKSLPSAAYVDVDDFTIPPHLADLDVIDGRCYSPQSAVQCPQSEPGIQCQDCAMGELGERWDLFKARTNSGTPKGKFYRDLDEAQARPDAQFARAQAWWRERVNHDAAV